MWTLPDVGGFKIIENGNITFSDNIGGVVSNITIGGLPVVQKYSGFYEFKNETGNEIKNLEVLRDGKSIGRFEKLNQVFYLGDNSSLYSGNGIDFTRGIITADYLQSKGIIVKNDGWAYDGYVEAFKSQKLNDPSKQKISNVEFDIYRYAENGYITMEFGQMSEKGYDFANIIVNNKSLSGVIIDGVVVPEKNLNPDRTSDRGGVFREVFTESSIAKLPAVNSIYNFEWQIDSSNSYYIDGFWIKSIGKPVYHDPQLPSDNIITATINFSATNVVSTDVMFKNVVVKVSNGASYNEEFVLTGKTLSLQLPKEDVYTVSVDNFMIGSKKFASPSNVTIDANNGDTNIDMVFTTVASGVYAVDVNGNLTTSPVSTGNYVGVLYSTTSDDIFINKTVTKNTAWGSTSDATGMVYTKENQLLNVQYGDGFANTNNIKSYATRPIPTIIDTLSKVKDLSSTVEWYIPSYNELFVVNADSSVNNMLNSIGASSMYNTNIWTSNVEDNTHAWTFNYNPSTETPTPTSVLRSNTNNNIIIFGRFKI
jgi:hypothetical protein